MIFPKKFVLEPEQIQEKYRLVKFLKLQYLKNGKLTYLPFQLHMKFLRKMAKKSPTIKGDPFFHLRVEGAPSRLQRNSSFALPKQGNHFRDELLFEQFHSL